jgi:hypothetical protein
MSRSWCLAIALLVSGSVAAAAAVSNSGAVMPTSRYAKIASHADGLFRVAAKTCNAASWQRSECVPLLPNDRLQDDKNFLQGF